MILGKVLSVSITSLKSFNFCLQCILCKPCAKVVNKPLIILTAIFLLQMLGISSASCQVITSIDLNVISQIESSGNPLAVNPNDPGGSYGLHQISLICLADYNRQTKHSYTKQDLFKSEINTKISDWYINRRIPQLLRHFHLEDSLENRLTAYNMGILAVKQGKRATRYIAKYRRLSNGTN